GLDVSGSLNMSESNVGGNSAAGGAGINVSGGTVSIDASSVHTNFASGDGAGIFSNGTITLTNSTISSNGAGGRGSGILNNVVGDTGWPGADQRGTARAFDGNGDGTPVCEIGSYAILQEIAPSPSPGPSGTAVEPIAVPETGGHAGRAGLPLWHMVVALSALA